MSSPGPPPTSVPKVVGPEKEDVSMREGTSSSSSDDEESSSDESTSDEQNGGESKENEVTSDKSKASNDTPSDANDDTKTPSSDQGTYLYLILLLTQIQPPQTARTHPQTQKHLITKSTNS
jgi:hypothetical protein